MKMKIGAFNIAIGFGKPALSNSIKARTPHRDFQDTERDGKRKEKERKKRRGKKLNQDLLHEF